MRLEVKGDQHTFEYIFTEIEDFTKSSLFLGDYIRLKGLSPGNIFCLESPDGSFQRTLMIGNATPYEGVSTTSHAGWDWELYNAWRVVKVLHLVADRGELLGKAEMEIIADGMKQ